MNTLLQGRGFNDLPIDLADLGFQIAHIETKSPIKLHQMDLIDQGEQEMLHYMSMVDWL